MWSLYIHRWSLYAGLITWKIYPWGPAKWSLYAGGVYIQVVLRAGLTVMYKVLYYWSNHTDSHSPQQKSTLIGNGLVLPFWNKTVGTAGKPTEHRSVRGTLLRRVPGPCESLSCSSRTTETTWCDLLSWLQQCYQGNNTQSLSLSLGVLDYLSQVCHTASNRIWQYPWTLAWTLWYGRVRGEAGRWPYSVLWWESFTYSTVGHHL